MTIFIKDGNFRPWVQLLLVLLGMGVGYLGSWLSSYWIVLVGVVICSVGGYSARAGSVGIKPFRESSKNKV